MAVCVLASLLYVAELHPVAQICPVLFTHSSADGQLGYFYFLATMNNAAIHIYV